MSTVFVHRYSGILSAYGLALADVVQEAQEPCAKTYQGTRRVGEGGRGGGGKSGEGREGRDFFPSPLSPLPEYVEGTKIIFKWC